MRSLLVSGGGNRYNTYCGVRILRTLCAAWELCVPVCHCPHCRPEVCNILTTYRLKQEFERRGLKLTRQTMSNWLLYAAEDWLKHLYDVLCQQLCA